MKQALQTSLGQHLAMTPRLQQAIRLLQLSTIELQAEIQEALESNVMLEPDEEDATPVSSEPSVMPLDIPGELPVDSAWDEIYEPLPAGTHATASATPTSSPTVSSPSRSRTGSIGSWP